MLNSHDEQKYISFLESGSKCKHVHGSVFAIIIIFIYIRSDKQTSRCIPVHVATQVCLNYDNNGPIYA